MISGILLALTFALCGSLSAAPLPIVLVDPDAVTSGSVSQWKTEQFQAVAVMLDDRATEARSREVARLVSAARLDLYWWIEVARNPKLATDHPRWMASLGSHDDWQKRFPKSPEPQVDEVAKAFPWVPISYRESFDAHLARIEKLLQRVPSGWRGLLLNDLQAGPSSCGCGNIQCRWAVDYHVRSTATAFPGDDVAARFVAEVRKRAGQKTVIPVWTTECEEVDLPAKKRPGGTSTGACGSVPCSTGTCPDAFTRQWSALVAGHDQPVGLLAVHTPLQRTRAEFGGGSAYPTQAISYLNQTLPAHGGKAISPERLWVVVEGEPSGDEATARKLAAEARVGALIIARTPIDQSYEPKIIPKN
jgi:hypothetical protein